MNVAIIIPNLNNAPYLDRCLASACGQTVPCDVIVVDGESTDGSQAIAAKYPVICLTAPPRGMANARNIGIAAADAEYIVPLDSDDWIESSFVERCVAAMEEINADVVATGLRWPDGRVQWPSEPISLERLKRENCLFTCSMFRYSIWEQAGGYREEQGIYEDWRLYLDMAREGARFAVVREPLFHYCPHAGSSTDKMHRQHSEYVARTVGVSEVFSRSTRQETGPAL